MARTAKLCKRIQTIAAQIILHKISDPRIGLVTVTKVELTEDYKYCSIYVSIFGSESQVRTGMRGLKNARGYLQAQIASRLSIRNAPIVSIKQDTDIEKHSKMSGLLKEAFGGDAPQDTTDGDTEIAEES